MTDGRWNPVASKRRAPGCSVGEATSKVAYDRKPADAGTRVSASERRTHSAPIPSGPRSHFCPGTAYASTPSSSTRTGIAPADCAPSMTLTTPASRAIAPTRSTGSTAPVVHSTWLTMIARAGRSRARSMAASVRSSSPPSPTSTRSSSTPRRSRSASSGPIPPGCSWRVVTTRSPGRQGKAPIAALTPSVVECVSAMSSGSATRIAATEARASAIRSRISGRASGCARPVASSRAACSSIARCVSAGIGPEVPALR